jgi:hypothetical protein
MKRFLAWAILPVGIAAAIAAAPATAPAPAAAQPLPTPYPEARYSQMSAKSPFAVATAVATAAPTPDFAAQLYVDGVVNINGTDFAAIKSRASDQPLSLFLAVGKTSDDGLKVERVKWSDEIGKSTVDVSKNGERATLAFDQDTIKTAGSQPGMPQPGGPGIRLPSLPGQGRPMNFPMQGGQQPQFNNRFAVPAQPGPSVGPPQPGNPLNALRRRTRPMIPSGQ